MNLYLADLDVNGDSSMIGDLRLPERKRIFLELSLEKRVEREEVNFLGTVNCLEKCIVEFCLQCV